MGNLITFIALIVFGSAIVFLLKKGFNEVIKALESIDSRLSRIEENRKISKQ